MEDPFLKQWEIVLGFVDIPTLCTARLVSKTVCSAASRHIKRICGAWDQKDKTVWFRGANPSNLLRHKLRPFPCLESVALSLTSSSPIKELVESGVLARVTHLGVRTCCTPENVAGLCNSPELVANLVRLTWYGMSRLKPSLLYNFPKLQDLSVRKLGSLESYGAIFKLTALTSLHMPLPAGRQAHVRLFSLARASALTKLQVLKLECTPDCPLDQLEHFGNMLSLTELVLDGSTLDDEPLSLLWLTRLSSLRKLKLCSDQPESKPFTDLHATQETLGVIGQMVSMADLEFPLAAGCDPGVLSALSGLTRLSLRPLKVAILECSPVNFNVGSFSALQSLDVDYPELTAASVSLVRSATKVTRLSFLFDRDVGQLDLRTVSAIASLTNLKALILSFRYDSPGAIYCGPALRPLKGLTYLECNGGGMSNADFKIVSRLTSLRVLSVWWARKVTSAILSDLTVLTCLDRLQLLSTSIVPKDITDGFRRAFDDHRLDRGWPPIDIKGVI